MINTTRLYIQRNKSQINHKLVTVTRSSEWIFNLMRYTGNIVQISFQTVLHLIKNFYRTRFYRQLEKFCYLFKTYLEKSKKFSKHFQKNQRSFQIIQKSSKKFSKRTQKNSKKFSKRIQKNSKKFSKIIIKIHLTFQNVSQINGETTFNTIGKRDVMQQFLWPQFLRNSLQAYDDLHGICFAYRCFKNEQFSRNCNPMPMKGYRGFYVQKLHLVRKIGLFY